MSMMSMMGAYLRQNFCGVVLQAFGRQNEKLAARDVLSAMDEFAGIPWVGRIRVGTRK